MAGNKYAPKFLFDAPVLWLVRLRRMVWAYVIVGIYVSLNLASNTYYYARHFPYIDDNRVMMIDFYVSHVNKGMNDDDYGEYHFFSDVLDFYSYTIFRDESNGKVSSLSYEPYGYKFIDEVNKILVF